MAAARRLALALLLAAAQGALVALLGTLADAAVAAAAIPAVEFHLLRGHALPRRASRNLSRLAATAQVLAVGAALASAAGPPAGLAAAATLAATAGLLLLVGARVPAPRRLRVAAARA